AVMPPSPRGRSLVWGSRGERRRYRSSDRPTRAELRKHRISIDWVRTGYAHRRAPRERLRVPDGRGGLGREGLGRGDALRGRRVGASPAGRDVEVVERSDVADEPLRLDGLP